MLLVVVVMVESDGWMEGWSNIKDKEYYREYYNINVIDTR